MDVRSERVNEIHAIHAIPGCPILTTDANGKTGFYASPSCSAWVKTQGEKNEHVVESVYAGNGAQSCFFFRVDRHIK